jgi:hypothetical protein
MQHLLTWILVPVVVVAAVAAAVAADDGPVSMLVLNGGGERQELRFQPDVAHDTMSVERVDAGHDGGPRV